MRPSGHTWISHIACHSVVGERLDRAHLAHAGAVDEHVNGLKPLPACRHGTFAGVGSVMSSANHDTVRA